MIVPRKITILVPVELVGVGGLGGGTTGGLVDGGGGGGVMTRLDVVNVVGMLYSLQSPNVFWYLTFQV